MFSRQEKIEIATKVERILLNVAHPEMPTDKPMFHLRVEGKESWSWADIKPNHTFNDTPPSSEWNERRNT